VSKSCDAVHPCIPHGGPLTQGPHLSAVIATEVPHPIPLNLKSENHWLQTELHVQVLHASAVTNSIQWIQCNWNTCTWMWLSPGLLQAHLLENDFVLCRGKFVAAQCPYRSGMDSLATSPWDQCGAASRKSVADEWFRRCENTRTKDGPPWPPIIHAIFQLIRRLPPTLFPGLHQVYTLEKSIPLCNPHSDQNVFIKSLVNVILIQNVIAAFLFTRELWIVDYVGLFTNTSCSLQLYCWLVYSNVSPVQYIPLIQNTNFYSSNQYTIVIGFGNATHCQR
jgi:hypothetical protein